MFGAEKNYNPALVRDGIGGVCRTFGADLQESKALSAPFKAEHAREYGLSSLASFTKPLSENSTTLRQQQRWAVPAELCR
jgi:hypothetical protein